MKLIGLHGKAGSGKDSSVDHLFCKKLAFAKDLKDAAKVLFEFTDDQLYDNKEKEKMDVRYGKSPREILQLLGTEFCRGVIDQKFHINKMRRKLEELKNTDELVIICDVRFLDELELIKEYGGAVIYIKRTGIVGGTTTTQSGHVSEKKLDDSLFDHVVVNDGTIDDLQRKIDKIIENL